MKRLYNFYMRSEKVIKMDGLQFRVSPCVFHPKFFFSSRLLKNELVQLDLQGKSMLDIGSGSGILSVFAAFYGANVTAIDISTKATETTSKNAQLNNLKVKVISSDLWENLPLFSFDYIAINPPFYPQNPEQEGQYAWFCGENFEYFNKLFEGVHGYMHDKTTLLMILSEDCQIDQIKSIAVKYELAFDQVVVKSNLWEVNYIFRIVQMKRDHPPSL